MNVLTVTNPYRRRAELLVSVVGGCPNASLRVTSRPRPHLRADSFSPNQLRTPSSPSPSPRQGPRPVPNRRGLNSFGRAPWVLIKAIGQAPANRRRDVRTVWELPSLREPTPPPSVPLRRLRRGHLTDDRRYRIHAQLIDPETRLSRAFHDEHGAPVSSTPAVTDGCTGSGSPAGRTGPRRPGGRTPAYCGPAVRSPRRLPRAGAASARGRPDACRP